MRAAAGRGALPLGEIAKAMGLFYRGPTNAPVPVVFGALASVKRKADGASEVELNQLAAELRKRSGSTGIFNRKSFRELCPISLLRLRSDGTNPRSALESLGTPAESVDL
jgi:hypothetical protein